MYNNAHSEEKEHCRKIIYNLVRNFKKKEKINVFTLPADNFILEEKLTSIETVGKIACVERDEEVYKKQLNWLAGNNHEKKINNYHTDAYDFLLNQTKISYDIIWLDLCSAVQPDMINKTLSLVQSNVLASKGYFAITFSCRREYYAKEIAKFYGTGTIHNFRVNGFAQQIISFAEMAGKRCKLINSYSYRSQKNSYPMMMQVFKFY